MRKATTKILCALFAVIAICAPLSGCKGGIKLSANAQKYFDWGSDYYKQIETRHKLNYDEMFFDDFSQGIDVADNWDIADSVWDEYTSQQNGVRPENIMLYTYPDDTTSLVVRSNGDFARNSSIKDVPSAAPLTGGVLSTKRAFGPGRYETRMKITPRVGALTTMWLFSWLETPTSSGSVSVYQSEIDIEMGLRPDFEKAYFTTWTAPSAHTNQAIDIAPINDGLFHTYTFDWSVTKNCIDYYIDGVKLATITENVPDLNATVSIGVWTPSFAGTITSPNAERGGGREYECDYAEFSYLRIIPFEETGWRQRTVTNRASRNSYKVPVLTELPVANKISNGDFDYTYNLVRGTYLPKPWYFGNISSGDTAQNGSGIIAENDTNSAATIIGNDYMRQFIQGSYAGYKYRLTGRYRTEGASTPFIRLSGHKSVYVESLDMSAFNQYNYLTASNEWTDFSIEFTVEDDLTKTLVLWFGNKDSLGTSYFDNLFLEFLEVVK